MARGDSMMRQWELLKTLQAQRVGLTADELADKLECSKRQIQRDLVVMQKTGFPISHEAGEHGRRRWRMTPKFLEQGGLTLTLTTTESLSLFLSKQLLAPLAGTQFGDGLASALEKVHKLLPEEALDYFHDDRSIFVKAFPLHDYSGQEKEIAIINKAMTERRVLKLRYNSVSQGKQCETAFHPYGLVFTYGNLYTIGFMSRYKETRTLKVSRIVGVQMTDESFQRPEKFSVRAYIEGAFGITRSNTFKTVRARFTGWAAHSIREQKWHASQNILSDEKGTIIAEFDLTDTTEIKRWILGFGRHAVVQEPANLAAEIQAELMATQDTYVSDW